WGCRRRRRRAACGPGIPCSAGVDGRCQDLLVQADGFRLRLRVELALERIHAELVLAQCCLPATKPCIERHDGAVHRLLERVQREKTKTGLDGRLVIASLLLIREQTAQALDR